MITITVTEKQAQDLLRATAYLYLAYEYGDDEYETAAIRQINNKVDDLRLLIKEAIKNGNS